MLSHFYWGIVTDNTDPDKMNRVRVSKEGDEYGASEWLPVVMPYPDVDVRGSFIPEIGELVMIVTFSGIHEYKGVLGSKWLNEAFPLETEDNTVEDLERGSKRTFMSFRSRVGSSLIIDNTESNEKVQFLNANGKTCLFFSFEDEDAAITTEHDITMSSDEE